MILVIAEKPSVAQSIAKVLGATSRKDGYMEGGKMCIRDRFQTAAIAQKYNCALKRLDFQQEEGLMSSLPILSLIHIYKQSLC